eukprot:COSAG01_NODE_3165_length_6476_cov_31.556845_2_plen_89_part_00
MPWTSLITRKRYANTNLDYGFTLADHICAVTTARHLPSILLLLRQIHQSSRGPSLLRLAALALALCRPVSHCRISTAAAAAAAASASP